MDEITFIDEHVKLKGQEQNESIGKHMWLLKRPI